MLSTASAVPFESRLHPRVSPESLLLDPSGMASKMSPVRTSSDAGRNGSTVSALVLGGLVDAAERKGIERERVLRYSTMVPPPELRSDVRVPRTELFRLCEIATDLTGDPAFGIYWIEGSSERSLAPVSHLVTHCRTLRRALELLAHYFPLLADDCPYRVYENEDAFTIQVSSEHHHSLVAQRVEAEMLLGGFCKLARIYDASARPITASFTYPAPDYHAEYARLFAGRARFDQPCTALVFERSLLDATSPQEHDDVREALEAVAEQRLARTRTSASYGERAFEFILRQGFPHRTDMESVARALEISPRSLRRHLEAEGSSYTAILRDARAALAKRLLRDRRQSIKDVAYEMGFSDANTFHRAFKAWTGVTPTDFRTDSFPVAHEHARARPRGAPLPGGAEPSREKRVTD